MSATQSAPDVNVRSQTYYVARTTVPCWHCGLSTQLLALAMPQNHETLHMDTRGGADDRPDVDTWQRANLHAFLFYVEYLPDGVQGRLSHISQFFRLAYSAATLNSYWANHCEYCGTLLPDHELHCEPDGAFMPSTEVAAANIRLLQIHEPFEAVAAGYAFEPEFFRSMRAS
jgi:hypothetical protein